MENQLLILQVNAISQLNFLYEDLKVHPPRELKIFAPGDNYLDKLENMLSMMNDQGRACFQLECQEHLRQEALAESKKMLITNYLYALLVNTRNNQISIYNNSSLNQSLIEQFVQDNISTIEKIKVVRDKVYAHLDLDWLNYVKTIEYEEIETCIAFLNKLFDINGEDFKYLSLA